LGIGQVLEVWKAKQVFVVQARAGIARLLAGWKIPAFFKGQHAESMADAKKVAEELLAKID